MHDGRLQSDGLDFRGMGDQTREIAQSHLHDALKPLRITCAIYMLCSSPPSNLEPQTRRPIITWLSGNWRPSILAIAMLANIARSVGILGKLDRDDFPWVIGLVCVLWYCLCTIMHFGFWYGGGVSMIEKILAGIQDDGLAFYSKADAEWLKRKTTRYVVFSNVLICVNCVAVAYSLFGPMEGLYNQLGVVMAYPSSGDMQKDRGLCIAYVVLHVFNSAAWLVDATALGLLCRCLTHAFQQLSTRVRAIEHWRRGANQDALTVHEIRMIHKKLALRTAQASKAFNPLLTTIFVIDLPLTVFLLFSLARPPSNGEVNETTSFFIMSLSIFWLISGILHLGCVSMKAWRVEGASVDIVVDLLEPEKTALLGMEDKQELQLFLESLRHKPIGFSVGHLLVTKALLGTMTSIILTYFVALITI
ncbi:hypothetical protein BSKO_09869 [Bryopsis sp. KO-2023]|nr:hypothetical protein BSKO_09869 [Bryopsis sp. KO-2023]